MRRSALLLTLTLGLLACSKKPDDAREPTPAPSKPQAPAVPSAAPEVTAEQHFPGWNMAARKQAWQGAWVIEGFAAGQWEAWDVQDLAVTVWDGTSERREKLSLTTPCTASISGPNGGYESHYTVDGDKLMTGLGDAGSRRGGQAIACVSNAVFTLGADGTCTEWSTFLRFSSNPGTCSLVKEGKRELFRVEVNGHTSNVPLFGDAIMSEQLKNTHAERMSNFTAAKIERDKRMHK